MTIMTKPALNRSVFSVENRHEAIDALSHGATGAYHHHATSPLIYYAASELISRDDKGSKTDIKAMGLPHQVLTQVSDELHSLGTSSFSSTQILEALEKYVIGLGSDFAREARAKPLYARIVVTDQKPNDLPDCDLVQVTVIDGQRRVGDGVSQRVMQSTIYGTRTSMTREMNLDEMFSSSRKKWLLIYYGSPSTDSYKEFDGIDFSLINAVQGLREFASREDIETIQDALLLSQGKSSLPDVIEDFSEIQKLTELYSGEKEIPKDVRLSLTKIISHMGHLLDKVSEFPLLPPQTLEVLREAVTKIAQSYHVPIIQSIAHIFTNSAANDDAYAKQSVGVSAEVTSIRNPEFLDSLVTKNLTQQIESQLAGIPVTGQQEPISLPDFEKNELQKALNIIRNGGLPSLVEECLKSDVSSTILNVKDQILVSSPSTLDRAINHLIAYQINKAADGQLTFRLPPEVGEFIRNEGISKIGNLSLPNETITALQQVLGKQPALVEMSGTSHLIIELNERLASPATSLSDASTIKQALQVLQQEGLSGALTISHRNEEGKNQAQAVIRSFIFENPIIADAVATQSFIRDAEIQLKDNRDTPPLRAAIEQARSEGFAATTDPQRIQSYPDSTRSAIETIIRNNPALVEVFATTRVIETLERQTSPSSFSSGPSAAEIRTAIEGIKQAGISEFLTTTPPSNSVLPSVERALANVIINSPVIGDALTTQSFIRDAEIQLKDNRDTPPLRAAIEQVRSEGFAATTDSQRIQSYPDSTRSAIETIIRNNPALVEVVATTRVIETLERQTSPSSFSSGPSAAEIRTAIEGIKQAGISEFLTTTPPSSSVLPSVERALSNVIINSPVIGDALTTQSFIRDAEIQLKDNRDTPPLRAAIEQARSEGFAATTDPQRIQSYPDSTRSAIETIIRNNPALVEVVATTRVIETLERQTSPSSFSSGPSAAEIRTAIEGIKQAGISEFLTTTPPSSSVLPSVERALSNVIINSPVIGDALTTQSFIRDAEIQLGKDNRDTPPLRAAIEQVRSEGFATAESVPESGTIEVIERQTDSLLSLQNPIAVKNPEARETGPAVEDKPLHHIIMNDHIVEGAVTTSASVKRTVSETERTPPPSQRAENLSLESLFTSHAETILNPESETLTSVRPATIYTQERGQQTKFADHGLAHSEAELRKEPAPKVFPNHDQQPKSYIPTKPALGEVPYSLPSPQQPSLKDFPRDEECTGGPNCPRCRAMFELASKAAPPPPKVVVSASMGALSL
jgi:anti-sigma factor RsiW